MIRAIIYCRVSTDDQNCDRQERDLREFADRAGYEIVEVIRETASGAKADRPERKKIMAAAQARKVSAVLVTEASRWSRSTIDLLGTLRDLNAWGVSLVTLSGISLDLSTSQGKLMAAILSAIAEFERDLIRERVKSGIASAKSKGRKFGRPRLSESAIAFVYELRAQGKSYSQIATVSGVSRTKVYQLCRTAASKRKSATAN
ncbi:MULTISPECIES: recombinase family protein [unclassified Microcoleus]|uniref:recombinase family protein n=1 Tax=unclassified Microcoleus TaxID=2642155 RepID=UPI002FD1B311